MICATKSMRLFLLGLSTVVCSHLVFAVDNQENTPADAPLPEFDCVIEPSEIVDVGIANPGVIERIDVQRNDRVKKGEVIATLESSVEQATLKLAKTRASLNTAIELRRQSAEFGSMTQKRNQALVQKAAISRQDMDQLRTETRIAELQVQQELENKRIAKLEYSRANAILQRRIIRSPLDGIVMERFKSAGEYVEEKPILRIAQLDPLHVEVIVPVEYLGRITPDMQAQVTAVVPGAATHVATVERVDVVADAASGTYGVRLNLPNPDYQISAGLRCKADFLPPHQRQFSNKVAAQKKGNELGTLKAEPIPARLR